MDMSQRFHLDNFNKVMECALRGIKEIYKILNEKVRNHVLITGEASNWGKKSKDEL